MIIFEWLEKAVTFIQSKIEDTTNPENYRPIICLPTTDKILPSILLERMYIYMENDNLFPTEQNICQQRYNRYKDQPLINSMILATWNNKPNNFDIAWIDNKKTVDTVYHS